MKNFKNYSGSSLDDIGLEPNIERDAFCTKVYHDHHSEMTGFAFYLVRNTRNPRILVEEIMQAYYTKLLNHHQTAKEGYNTSGVNYLRGILKNEHYDYLRSIMKNKEDSPLITELYENISETTDEIDVDTERILREVEEILNTLKLKHAEIFRDYLGGIPQALIAERLNKPTGTINSIISRTRALIRKKVKP